MKITRPAMFNARSLVQRTLRYSAVLLAAVLFSVLAPVAAAGVAYTYDEAGRLVGVYAPNGDAAQYVYDAAGNIIAINRFPAGTLAIIEFTPNQGPVGTTVTIYGTGFSSTISSNAVTFNGIAATVTSAAATQLVAKVPAGATTGKISVTVAGTTATSVSDFVVGTFGAPPTITGFAPTIGTVGTAVAVTGTNFDPAAVNDKLRFNNTFAALTSATASQVQAVVPANATSGKIKVGTPYGTATSAADFFVPPGTYTAADVGATARAAVNGAAVAINLSTAAKIGLVVFDGNVGDLLSLQLSSFVASTGSLAYSVYNPFGVVIASGTLSATSQSVHIPTLTTAGTHTVMLNPGTGTASFSLAVKSAASLVVNAAAVSLSTGTAGQSLRLKFVASANQSLGLGVSNLALTGATYGYVYAYRSDGSQLLSQICYATAANGPGCQVNLNRLAAGTYTVVIVPISGATGTFDIQLNTDVTGTLTANTGLPVVLKSGQNARLTFTGAVGQSRAIELSQLATVPVGRIMYAYVYRPSDPIATTGTGAFTGAWLSTSTALAGVTLSLPALPAAGTYTVIVDTTYQETANVTVTLEAGVVLVPDAAALSATIANAGETARFTFTGAVGQNFGLGVSNLALVGATYGYVYVYKPDGTQLLNSICYATAANGPGCQVNLNNLPVAGTYSVVVVPQSGATGSFNIQLNTDVTGTLTANTARPVVLKSGQNARLTFAGTAGQSVAMEFAQVTTTPAARTLYGYVYRPTDVIGATAGGFTGYWQYVSIPNTGATLSLPALPAAGTYTVIVDTTYQETANVTVTLEAGVVLVPDAAALSATIANAGETARFTFTGAVGQNFGLGVSNLALVGATYGYVYVYKPDGTQLLNSICYATAANGPGCQVNLNNLPVAGTYSVVVVPQSGATGSFNIQLNTDVTGTLTANTARPVVLKSGQNARLTFAGTAGQSVAMEFAQVTTTPAARTLYGYVYRPTDVIGATAGGFTGYWQYVSIPNTGATLSLPALPAAGTYTVIVDTTYQETANVTVTLEAGVVLVPDAAALSATIANAGETARFTFTGAVGQNFGLGVSNLALVGATYGYVYVYKPDGTQLLNSICYATAANGPGCQVNLNNLPVAGTYSVVVVPQSGATGSFNIQLNTDVTGTLTANTARPVVLKSGQNARLTFAGTAGQSVAMEFAQVTTTPAARTLYGYVYRPTDVIGATAGGFTGYWQYVSIPNTGATLSLPALPAAGTYTVIVDTTYQETANVTVTLEAGVVLVPDAAALSATIANAGETARFTFTGAVGQNFGLGVSNLALVGATYGYVYVYKPDGTQLLNSICYATAANGPGCQVNLNNLPVAGTYSVVVVPQSGATGSFNIQLNTDVTGTLTANTARPVVLKSGQNARLTFAGTAGQSVAMEFAQVTTTPAARTLYGYVYRPTDVIGATAGGFTGYWQYVSIPNTGATLSLPALPAAGTYTVIVDTTYQETANVTVTLEAGVVLVPDAAALSATIANAGETARFTFTGAVGQNFGLGVSNLALVGATYGYVYVYKPDGTQLLNSICYATAANGPGCQVNLNNLPVAGTYSVVVVPQSGATGSFNIQLNTDVTGTLTANTARPVVLKSGQNARLTFAGTAGQSVAMEFAQVTTTPAARTLYGYVYRPTDVIGATAGGFTGYWQYVSIPNTGATLSLPALPAAGTYTVIVDTTYQETANVTVTLEAGVVLVPDAAALSATIANAGETARFTFTGAVGQNFGLGVSNLALVGATYGYVYVYKPDGTQLLNSICYATAANGPGCQVNLNNLPVAGTYSVVVVPQSGATGSFNIQLNTDVTGTLTANTARPVVLKSGQNARLTFAGTAGQSVAMEFAQVTTTPAARTLYGYVYRPTDVIGATAGGFTGYWQYVSIPNTGATLSLPALPAAGTYTVIVDTTYQETANVTVTLEAGVVLVPDAAALSATIANAGETARFTFTGAVGQNFGLGVSNLALVGATYGYVYVYKPDGTQLLNSICYATAANGPGCQVNLNNLPVAGTYSVVVVPQSGATGSFNIQLNTDVTGTLTANTARPVVLKSGQNARLTFAGTAGQYVTIGATSVTTNPSGRTLYGYAYRPTDVIGATAGGFTGYWQYVSIPNSGTTWPLPALPATGTYTVILDTTYQETASVSLTPTLAMPISVDGSAVAVVGPAPGIGVRLQFAATAGQSLGLGITGLTHTPASGSPTYVYVYKPDGVVLVNAVPCYTSNPGGGCNVNLSNLPQTGTYSVYLGPPATSTLSATLTLSNDIGGTLTSGAAAVALNLRAGQNGRYTFSGTAGQVAGAQIAHIVTVPPSQAVQLTMYKPDGTQLATFSSGVNDGAVVSPALPVTGTYTVFIDPTYAAPATMTVALNPAGDLIADGAAVNVTTITAGLGHELSFAATAGQSLGLGITGLTHTPASGSPTYVYVYKPDGVVLVNAVPCYTSNPGGGCNVNLSNLPQTGTYSVYLGPPATSTLSATLTLSNDIGGTLTSGAAAVALNLRAGQNGRYTFSGTAGQVAGAQIAHIVTVPPSQAVQLTMYKPDGTQLATFSSGVNDGAVVSPALPVTGTYTVFIDPTYAAPATMTVALNPAGDLIADGAAVNVTTITAGLGHELSFAATAGQSLGLGITGLTHTPASGSPTYVYVYKPDGVVLVNAVPCYTSNPGGGCNVNLSNLPQTGTYSVYLGPPATSTLSATLTLSNDIGGTLTSGAAAVALNLRAGQNGRYTFSGTAGQVAGAQIAHIVTVPPSQAVQLTMYKPDGTQLATFSSGVNDGAVVSPALPVTGTYTVFIDPTYAAPATMTVALNPAGDLIADGAAVNVTTITAGLGHELSFAATAGQSLGLGITGLTHTPASGSPTYVYVYKPDGVVLVNAVPCYTSNPGGGCNVNLSNLPQTGTYSVYLGPPATSTLSATLTLSNDIGGTLTSGAAAVALNLRAGQNGRYTFSGTAGQVAGAQIAHIVTVPPSQAVQLTMYKPDGTQLATFSSGVNDGAVVSPALPVTGTYTVFIDPTYAAPATMTVALNPAGDLIADGAAVNVTTITAGLGHELSFAATAGQSLGLGITGLTHTPASGSPTYVYVYKPDGVVLVNAVPCYTSNPGGGCNVNLSNLPQTGTYSVYLGPPATSTLSATLTLSNDTSGALIGGTPTNVNITRLGQNARYTFSGTATQTSTVVVASLATVPASQTVVVTVFKPDGTQLATQTSAVAGVTLNLGALPVTGTYTVVIDPNYAATATMTLTKTP